MTTACNRRLFLAIVVIAALAVSASQASADLITTGGNYGTAPTLVSNPLSESATVSKTGTMEWSQDLTLLNNGSLGGYNDGTTIVNGVQTGNAITFTFDTTTNTAGYDITGIQSYAAWYGANRCNQGYAVGLTFVGGTTGTLLAKTAFTNAVTDWTKATIANSSGTGTLDNGSGVVATGVKSITFSNFDVANAGSGPVGYREFQIEGAATVTPEPGTIILLITGMIGLLAYAWRRRK